MATLTLVDKDSLKDNAYGSIEHNKTMKDLKLRIIHGPLSSISDSNICCLCCCRDIMGRLSAEERVIALSCGYIRQCTQKDIPPVIIDLCVSYVGTSKQFDKKVLKSFAEIRQKPRIECLSNCQDCWKDFCQDFLSFNMCFGACCDSWENYVPTFVAPCCKCWTLLECFTNYACCFGYFCDITLAILILISIGVTFAKDITALIINHNINCNISGGSIYTRVNVYEWLLIGAVSDSGLWVCSFCFIASIYLWETKFNGNCSDLIVIIFIGCIGGIWFFFIAWIIIGFMLYSEMVYYDINSECLNIVMAWNILQIIPTVSVLCFVAILIADHGGCNKFVGSFFDAYEASEACCAKLCNKLGTGMCRGLCLFVLVTFIFAKDIAALIVNSNNDCNIIDGGSKYILLLDVTEWIYIGSICHMSGWLTFIVWSACVIGFDPDPPIYYCLGLCIYAVGFFFNIAWMVVGFILYSEMLPFNNYDAICGNTVLSWNVLQLLETSLLLLLFCGVISELNE